ncbi:MAG: hypothetical protein JWN30_625 [Bacilli bacterium]|nr:hypothetical protein [Bacilli bacterium]
MDICCGLTMVARLENVYSEGGVLIQDVPLLVCPTCRRSQISPDILFDYQMYAYYCETDGARSGSLSKAIGEEKILHQLEKYPEDIRIQQKIRVIPEQIDNTLDLMNLADLIGDDRWHQELVDRITHFSRWIHYQND